MDTIVVGDFNIDLKNISTSTTSNYYGIQCSRVLKEFVNSYNLSQIITKDTWFREISGTMKSSRSDHVYISENVHTTMPTHIDTAYSDHQMITIELLNTTRIEEENTPVWTRSWYKYSSERLIEKLSSRDWTTDIKNMQGHYDWLIQNLLEIADEIAPMVKKKCVNISNYHTKDNRNLINKHRKLVARWKKHGNIKDKKAVNIAKKQLRAKINSDRRNKVRKHIKPSNQKSLWDAIKIAKDENTAKIPLKMQYGKKIIERESIPEVFPNISTTR
jgi:hypothetical protein